MLIIERAEVLKQIDGDWKVDHIALLLEDGNGYLRADVQKCDFEQGQEIQINDLQSPPVRIPDEDIWPLATSDFTPASLPISNTLYLKKPFLSNYNPESDKDEDKPYHLILHEAKICEKLRAHPHRNIASYSGCVIEHGFIKGLCFAKYKETLSERLVCVGKPPLDIHSCLQGIKAGIDHLHSLGLNHNDINPFNIMLDDQDVPIIIDFDSCCPDGISLVKNGTPDWTEDDVGWKISASKNDNWALERLGEYVLNVPPKL